MDLLNLFVKIGVKDEASEAVEGVSQNIIGKLGKAAATAAKALAGMFVVKKVVDFGKAAFDSYAQYQQLVGGVDKLFGDASDKLQEYAQQAYSTSGMSANQYMEQVTSFSAALINSLGGDTAAAAEQADVAMRAMSDNVNTFGTDMQSVQMAFQGFAKQNYTMLDNLKLGYGGTKTEMERLIKDANEYAAANGKAADLSVDSFSDIVTAIELIQEKQHIAGTTAKEAATTIEGSMNATKAAWSNLVTEFGKPDADIGARISDMFTAVMGKNGEGGLARNVINEVRVIATNMINAVSGAISTGISYIASNGPTLVSKAMDAIGNALSSATDGLSKFVEDFDLVDAIFGEGGVGDSLSKVGDFIGKIGDTIAQKWPEIQSKLGELLSTLGTAFETVMPQVMEVAGRLVTMAGQAIAEHGPELLGKLGEVVGKAIAGLVKFAADMSQKGHEFMAGLITGTSDEGKKLHEWFANFFPDGLLKGLGDFATFLLDAGKALINGLLDGIGQVAPDVESAIRTAFDSVIGFFQGIADFIADPMGSIEGFVASLTGTSETAAASVDGAMASVSTSTANAAADIASYNAVGLDSKSATATVSGNAQDGSGGKSVKKYNDIKLTDKKATAIVTGNAQDGKAKTSVENTNKAVRNLSGKSISVSATGNVISGVAAAAIGGVKSMLSNLKSKAITLTTYKKEVKTGGAWGGITPRYHATGGVRVADRWGEGVPLDVVGERGPEAIVPLSSRYGKDFARMMGQEASKYMSGPTYILQIGDIQYNTDKAMDEAIDHWFSVAARKAGQYGIAK
jgi:phage-related protein